MGLGNGDALRLEPLRPPAWTPLTWGSTLAQWAIVRPNSPSVIVRLSSQAVKVRSGGGMDWRRNGGGMEAAAVEGILWRYSASVLRY